MSQEVSKWPEIGFITTYKWGIPWGCNPCTNHLLTSWDVQVGPYQAKKTLQKLYLFRSFCIRNDMQGKTSRWKPAPPAPDLEKNTTDTPKNVSWLNKRHIENIGSSAELKPLWVPVQFETNTVWSLTKNTSFNSHVWLRPLDIYNKRRTTGL